MTYKKKLLFAAAMLTVMFFSVKTGSGAERFPFPEFTGGYQIPAPVHPWARTDFMEYLDVVVLTIALLLSSFLAIKKRSRSGLYLLAVFSILYFGFYRRGCICPVGSLQNVTLSLFDPNYLLPFGVLLIFLLPLVFTLFFGRTFCSSVCPLGAIQEVFIFKPVKLPGILKQLLSVVPYIYLGTAVVFASTGSGFIICKYDPFIGFYRMGASPGMLIFGGLLLIGGIFIARPYCRMLCPYGALLGIFSYFSARHLKITPDNCIQCRLCENSCPVDAINRPSPARYKTDKRSEIKKLGIYLLLLPVFVLVTGFAFSRLSDLFAEQNSVVRLAGQIYNEESGGSPDSTLDSDAFREKEMSIKELYGNARSVRRGFGIGTWIVGIFLGFVIFLKMLSVMRRHKRKDYEPDRVNCVSCGRCMEYCPVQADI